MARATWTTVILALGLGCSPRSTPAEVALSQPKDVAQAWVEELDYLEHIVDLWWAAKDLHQRLDGVDSKAVFAKAKTKAERCDTIECYADVIDRALCNLGDGHLRLNSEWWLKRKNYRSEYRFVSTQEGPVVVKPTVGELLVRYDESCERPGSTPGQRQHIALEALSNRARFGAAPPPTTLTLKGRESRQVVLKWTPGHQDMGRDGKCAQGRQLRDRVAYLEVSTFWCSAGGAASFERFKRQVIAATASFSPTEHLILDLRENGGGMDHPARWLASQLIEAPLEWMRFRHPRPYEKAPSKKFFRSTIEPGDALEKLKASKLWLLIGPGCFSTCDTFVSAMRGTPNVTLVGERTAGGVGNPTPFRLPYSGLTVRIPVSLYALPGEENVLLEGTGVAPNLKVQPTIEDIRNGRDAVLEAVLRKLD